MEKGRTFAEVFPDYPIPESLDYILHHVIVTRVVMKKQTRELIIYIKSRHLLSRRMLAKLAYELKQALFPKERLFVRIEDRYELSDLYDFKRITKEYWESILYDIKNRGRVEYSVLSGSKWRFDEDRMILNLEDSFIARDKAKDLKDYFESLFRDRFGCQIHVDCHFRNHLTSRHEEEKQHRLDREVGMVMERLEKAESADEGDRSAGKDKDGAKTSKRSGAYGGSFFEERARKQAFKRSGRDPDLIYGRDCEGELISIGEIVDEIGLVVIHGEILSIDTRPIKGDRTFIRFHITDFTDSIIGKIYLKDEEVPDFLQVFRQGRFYRVKGQPLVDRYEHELVLSSVRGIKPVPDFSEKRMDHSLDKRVELHLHTVMSDLDSVVDIEKVINTAKSWGHKALAITDHGVLQAFPIAHHCLKKDDDFKVIYGVEGYFVNDRKKMVINEQGQTLSDDFVVFDLETTGFSAEKDSIIEIGAVKVSGGKITDRYATFVNPDRPIPLRITELTDIDDAMVANAPRLEQVLPEFLAFCSGCCLVAHNASFDVGFIERKMDLLGYSGSFTVLDTVQMARLLLTDMSKFRLDTVCRRLGIKQEHHHRAVDDAKVTAEVFLRFVEMLEERGITSLKALNEAGSISADLIRKAPTYHGIILVKNETGRVNLNRLVSASHLDYFNRRPRIPESLIEKYREGLLIGSACEAGELFTAVTQGKSDRELAEIASFYDYLEIQPLGNNAFMIESDRHSAASMEDLKDYNRKIIEIGEKTGKPVAATGDVHFLNPEDEQYRRILMAGKGFKDADHQAPLYFRTTEEMLAEFDYLGDRKAREVVIETPGRIADMIEKISPIHPDKCPPVIPNSDETLTRICYDKAHEIYGPELPAIVEERLTRELDSIISNQFAVMYIIAQKLVWDSNEHGYLVGSRGSVGSSFVATMSGITEVNPLKAHYICPKCHFNDFDSDLVKPYQMKGMSGCDLPDRDCPVCGNRLNKEGHDIPFETFLGFEGNKEPDIDLNFSGEYQAKAHKYVEVIFGEGKAFRAGTIGTLADKTAYGYVMKYFEERGISKRRCEIERIAKGCTGVKRTTGQHPGGIIVVPHEHEIYEFTAVQHPANDIHTDIVTTHFEYHSIDHNLLKLDILGHDDPTMIRRLEDLTGVKATGIPLDDPEVMKLFHSPEVLGISPEQIEGVQTGSLGVPEFGTDFVIQMLVDTKPRSFSDLVRISGLSHGTDVWLGNAQTLIENGDAEISTAICCRDDIMTYLINMGMEKEKSFLIMESVRKGKGLRAEWEEEMLSCGVPEWYIWSCKKIKYMFPKAHAAAYVMMGWRVAWYKVHRPLEYYTAYFSIRASAFSYEVMCFGKDRLKSALRALNAMPKEEQTKKDQDTIRDGRIALEMYERGFEFMPIDIFRARAMECRIIDGKIMPSLASVEGLGEKACEQIVEAAAQGPFTSLANFRDRTKVSKTNVEKLAELSILTDLPETDQLTIADFLGQM
ncbi:MAG: PolC-type DNA polymerase III [Eubacterium sp.]|nr:PolC-type DNA polymerase III [Eubacterium sp.]